VRQLVAAAVLADYRPAGQRGVIQPEAARGDRGAQRRLKFLLHGRQRDAILRALGAGHARHDGAQLQL